MKSYLKILELQDKIRLEEINAVSKGHRTKVSSRRVRIMLTEIKKLVTEAKKDLMRQDNGDKKNCYEKNTQAGKSV